MFFFMLCDRAELLFFCIKSQYKQDQYMPFATFNKRSTPAKLNFLFLRPQVDISNVRWATTHLNNNNNK